MCLRDCLSVQVGEAERHRVAGTELLLLILLDLSRDAGFSDAIHGLVLQSGDQIPWFRGWQQIKQCSLGSLILMVACRAISRNVSLVSAHTQPPPQLDFQNRPDSSGMLRVQRAAPGSSS